MTLDDVAWMFLVDNRNRLMTMCRNATSGSGISPDEAWSEVVLERMPRIYELYEPDQGPLWNYAANNLKWYLRKFVAKRKNEPLIQLDNVDEEGHNALFDKGSVTEYSRRLAVLEILESVSEDHRLLISLKFFYALTFEEMAAYLDCSVGSAYKRYTDALEAALVAAGVQV